MTTTTLHSQKNQSSSFTKIFLQIMLAVAGGFIFFSILVVLMFGAYNIMYWGRIFPGVRVAGVDVSGLSPQAAEQKLNQIVTYPFTGKILLQDGNRVWVTAPVQMGMLFDPAATARNAYAAGRSGGLANAISQQVRTLQSGVDMAPIMILDEGTAYEYIQAIAAEIDQPVVEAALTIDGTTVTDTPGQVGRLVNVDKTLALVSRQMQTFTDGEVQLVVEEKAPEIMSASAPAEAARKILSSPLTLTLPSQQAGDPGPWTIPPAELAAMLQVDRVNENGQMAYKVSVNQIMLKPYITEIAGQLDRQPQNARFIFDDTTRALTLLQPSVTGYVVKVDDTLAAVNEAIPTGQQVVNVTVETLLPSVTSDATAESLGISENIITYATYFRGSSEQRIQNIKTSAEKFHGLLIAPGETFSMGEALGDVSLDNGYAEAMIIYGGKTIKGVGGGVCQVSTTLFRTVFNAGFPVVERYAHAYRVSYYEQVEHGIDPDLSGLDATVYFPLVDFKFTNDTPYWLLMETYVNEGARRITWKFYSTSDGRSVEWNTTGPTNQTPPPDPAFVENPEMGPGDIKQVDWAAVGADVYVNRTVYRDGNILFTDDFPTHYEPWQAVCEYGPGTEDPRALAAERGICQP